MHSYKTFGTDAEVYGKAILASFEAIPFKILKPILEKHGFNPLQTDRWYPQQAWLNVFTDIARIDNPVGSHLISTGIKIAENIYIPPKIGILPFEKAMSELSEYYYRANHRGIHIGFLDVQMVHEKQLMIIDGTPYPDSLIYGIYYGMTRRLLPSGRYFTVRYDEKEPRREKGGVLTIIHIRWE